MSNVVLGFLFASIVAVTAALMGAMPWLEARGQCFAVTVPVSAARDPRLEAERRSYAVKVAVLAVACAAAICAALAADASARAGAIALLVASLALVIIPFALMLRGRSRVRAIKAKAGWRAERQVRVAAIGEAELPGPVPVAWELLHVPLALLAAGLGCALLPQMPARVAIHFDAAGVANDWIDRGPAAIVMPVMFIALMGIVFAACHLMAVRSKPGVSADAPAATALGYALFTRAMTLMLLVTGLALNAVFALLPLQFAGILPVGAWIAACLVVAAIAVGWSIWIASVYGQNGSLAAARMMASGAEPASAGDTLSADDDRLWRLGIFYADENDAAVLVPKRFGIGWTLNWARPASWGIVLGFIALTVGAIGFAAFIS